VGFTTCHDITALFMAPVYWELSIKTWSFCNVMKKFWRVTFLPENKIICVEDRKTIFETIELENHHDIQLNFSRCCGAEGICQKCKIRALQKMGPLTLIEKSCLSEEERARGIRLACQARVIQDTQVEIIYKQHFSVRLEDEQPAITFELRPRVTKMFISSADEPASLELAKSAQQQIATFLENTAAGCTAVLIDGELTALEEGDTISALFAAAVDLGINTLVMSLIDLSTGKSIAVVSDTNPQHYIEPDLEKRINLGNNDSLHLEMLSEEVLLRIDVLLRELCQAKGIAPRHIYEITLSGTTGMLHLFLKGLPGVLEQHAEAEEGKRISFTAQNASIKASPGARMYALPVISSYVGADITAGIIATQMHRSQETVLFLDIGSTCKAVLYHQGKLLAAGIANGAAFEGIGIRFGMRPEAGAIESVTINGDIHVEVLGESLPRGICGSGLIELTAELIKGGLINSDGDFTEASLLPNLSRQVAERLIIADEGKAFLLYRDQGEFASDIYVTQDDLYALRQAKAHLAAAIKLLLQKEGISFCSVKKILVGGAFGYHINPESFIHIGLIPQELSGQVFFVGNTSKAGAHLALLDREILAEAERIAQRVECFEPHQDPHFESAVQESLHF
jgi:uncharacterized 2Fe-2S/4Fe-4S cluster protein (DUF4445 family)